MGAGRADHPRQRGVGIGPGLWHPEWQDEQRCDRSAQHRRRDPPVEHHRLLHLVLGAGSWRPLQQGTRNRPAPGLPLPSDGLAGDQSRTLGTALPRLPLCQLHQRQAFSPTDTTPLSRWATSLMALQSAIALLTTALVLARAVNVLK